MSYKRVVITEFGDPDVLKVVEESAPPRPGAGEVRVLASGSLTFGPQVPKSADL